MVRKYANEHNQTMEFPKLVKRNDRISRAFYLGAKITFQYLDYSKLIFGLNYQLKIIFMVVKHLILLILEYVRTISFI